MTAAPRRFSAARELELLHPRNGRQREIIVLRAYLDASGKHQSRDPFIVVAGIAVGDATYVQLADQWDAFLEKNGLTVFHATQFWARERPYDSWSDEKHKQAQEDILTLLADCKPFGLAVGVDTNVYRDWQQVGSFPFYHEDPYYFCLDRCLQALIRGISEHPKDEGILIYCDQETEHHEMGHQLARWHINRTRRGEHGQLIDPQRVVELTYGSKFCRKLLMVADLFANLMFRIKTGSADAEQQAFSQRLIRETFLTAVMFKTVDHIE